MTEMPRVSMYWVQQPISVIPHPNPLLWDERGQELVDYVVVWHCCESWDLLTCKLYDQEVLEPIKLAKVSIWDSIVIDWTWAYNSSMSMKNYNSFPEAGEVMIMSNNEIKEIRKRQNPEDIWKNEIEVI